MTSDRLHKDSEKVENLDDLIEAREERHSRSSDDTDGMPDEDVSDVDIDVSRELGYPHHHGESEDQRLGLNTDLMSTAKERDEGVNWQDSADEMLQTDPNPDEGVGAGPPAGIEIEDLLDIMPPEDVTADAEPDAEVGDV